MPNESFRCGVELLGASIPRGGCTWLYITGGGGGTVPRSDFP